MRWRDQRGLTLALTIGFGAMVAASALFAVALANRLSVVRDLRAGHFDNLVQRVQDADDFASNASALYSVTQLVLVVLFIIWMFRAAKNNEALGRTGARFGPGWSIGAWFIPFANLVIPVLIMQDLWRGSTSAVRRGDAGWRTASGSVLIACWWTAWVVSFLRFAASNAAFGSNGSLDDIETSNTIALIAVVATAIAAALAVFVVRALARRQLETLQSQRAEYEAGAGGAARATP
jgi:hypothetical protein